MSSSAGLLCHAAGGGALAYKHGGGALIYKADPASGGGGGEGGATRSISVEFTAEPLTWIDELGDQRSVVLSMVTAFNPVAETDELVSHTAEASFVQDVWRIESSTLPRAMRVEITAAAFEVWGNRPAKVSAFVAVSAATMEVYQFELAFLPNQDYAREAFVVLFDSDGKPGTEEASGG